MTFSGMDVGEVERLADQLQVQVAVVEGLISVVDRAVSALSVVWEGEDVHRFAGLWHQAHRPKTQAAAEGLATWLGQLRQQARSQELTSRGIGGGAGVEPYGIAGTWEFVLSGIGAFLDKGHEVLEAAGSLTTGFIFGRFAPRDEFGRFVRWKDDNAWKLARLLKDPDNFVPRAGRIGNAFSRWSKLDGAMKVGGRAFVVAGGVVSGWEQWVEDTQSHPGMNDGVKAGRAAVVGGSSLGGTVAGAEAGVLIGAAVGGPPGALIGGVVGGIAGSEVGQTLGKMAIDMSVKPAEEELAGIGHDVSAVAGGAVHLAGGAAHEIDKALHFWH